MMGELLPEKALEQGLLAAHLRRLWGAKDVEDIAHLIMYAERVSRRGSIRFNCRRERRGGGGNLHTFKWRQMAGCLDPVSIIRWLRVKEPVATASGARFCCPTERQRYECCGYRGSIRARRVLEREPREPSSWPGKAHVLLKLPCFIQTSMLSKNFHALTTNFTGLPDPMRYKIPSIRGLITSTTRNLVSLIYLYRFPFLERIDCEKNQWQMRRLTQ